MSHRDRSREGSVPHVRACHLSFVRCHDQSRCQDPTRHHPVRGDVGPEPRASSASSILDLAAERRASSFLLRFVRSSSHPCRPTRSVRPRPGRTADSRYPAPPRFALRLPSVGSGKMLLTDICNRRTTRALVNRSTTERTAFAAPTPQSSRPPRTRNRSSELETNFVLRCAGPSCDNPTPVGSRLTARGQLQPVTTRCFHLALLSKNVVSGCPLGLPPQRSVVFSDGAARLASDTSWRPRDLRFYPETRGPEPAPSPTRQSERLRSVRDAFDRQMLPGERFRALHFR
jgi:hypothetical protein